MDGPLRSEDGGRTTIVRSERSETTPRRPLAVSAVRTDMLTYGIFKPAPVRASRGSMDRHDSRQVMPDAIPIGIEARPVMIESIKKSMRRTEHRESEIRTLL